VIDFRARLLEKDTYRPSVLSRNIRVELLDSGGNRLLKKNLGLTDSQVAGTFTLPDDLKSGWYSIRAYTNWMRNFPDSEYTVVPFRIVNLSDYHPGPKVPAGVAKPEIKTDYRATGHQVSIHLDSEKMNVRGNYTLDYSLPDSLNQENIACINTLIVWDEPGNQTENYLPGLPGFSPGNSGIQFFPETRSGILMGRVTNRDSRGVAAVGIGMTILGDNSFDAVETNEEGVFCFSLPDRHNSADYILNFLSDPDSSWTIRVFPEYDDRPVNPNAEPFILTPEEYSYASELLINNKLNAIYSRQETPAGIPPAPVARKETFFNPPERKINVDDYIELASVQEVVYEVVPDVQIRHRANRTFISVYNKNPFARDYQTLILLDGIPLTNQQELLALPPGRIRTIEVKNRMYVHGNCIFSGLVNFISRNGDYAGLRLPRQSVMGSIDLPAESVQPVPAEPAQAFPEIPVLNPVLLWSSQPGPARGKINFQTNDLTGGFTITVSGFDPNGLWFYGQRKFTTDSPGSGLKLSGPVK
jgi:hypothetical protein